VYCHYIFISFQVSYIQEETSLSLTKEILLYQGDDYEDAPPNVNVINQGSINEVNKIGILSSIKPVVGKIL